MKKYVALTRDFQWLSFKLFYTNANQTYFICSIQNNTILPFEIESEITDSYYLLLLQLPLLADITDECYPYFLFSLHEFNDIQIISVTIVCKVAD